MACALSLINFVLTTVIHYCCGLSPRLNLTTNVILLILWLASLGVLCWSMSQTILTTCTETYWGNSTGISICRIYKTFFSFTAIATVTYIAAITLDVIVRKRQTRLGVYGAMSSQDAMLADLKLGDRNGSSSGSGDVMAGGVHDFHNPNITSNNPYADESDGPGYLAHSDPPEYNYYRGGGGGAGSVTGSGSVSDVPPYSRPAPVAAGRPYDHLENYHADEARDCSDAAPGRGVWGVPRVRFSALDRSGYAHPPEQTSYDPGAYR